MVRAINFITRSLVGLPDGLAKTASFFVVANTSSLGKRKKKKKIGEQFHGFGVVVFFLFFSLVNLPSRGSKDSIVLSHPVFVKIPCTSWEKLICRGGP